MQAHEELRADQGMELCFQLTHWGAWEEGGELTNGEEAMLSECSEHSGKPWWFGYEQSKLRHIGGEKE